MALTHSRPQTVTARLDSGTELLTVGHVRHAPDFAKRVAAELNVADLERWLRSVDAMDYYDDDGVHTGPDSLGVAAFFTDDAMTTFWQDRGRGYGARVARIVGPFVKLALGGKDIAQYLWTGDELALISHDTKAIEAGEQWFQDQLLRLVSELSDWPPCPLIGRQARLLNDGEVVTIVGEAPNVRGEDSTYAVLHRDPSSRLEQVPAHALELLADRKAYSTPSGSVAIAGVPNAGEMRF